MTDRNHTRRTMLRASAMAVAVGLAGCGGDGAATDTPTPTPTPTEAPDATFSVEDQTVEDHVLVTDVRIHRPGWVIVWPEAEDGGPDFPESTTEFPIAKGYLDVGSESEVRAESGDFVQPPGQQLGGEETWYVVMHYDDPRNQTFEYPDGDQPVEVEGEMVMQSFTASPADGDGGD